MMAPSCRALPVVVRALAVAGGVLALSACAAPERQAPASGQTGEPPAYEYRGTEAETSPLLYEPGSIERPGAADSQRQAAEQCHSYARALIGQDRRISHDRDSRRSGQIGSSRTFGLSRSMQQFSERGSYDRYFSRCMESAGFEPES